MLIISVQVFSHHLTYFYIAEIKLLSMDVNQETVVGILNICKNESANLVLRMAAATFLKTTFSKIYNVSLNLT